MTLYDGFGVEPDVVGDRELVARPVTPEIQVAPDRGPAPLRGYVRRAAVVDAVAVSAVVLLATAVHVVVNDVPLKEAPGGWPMALGVLLAWGLGLLWRGCYDETVVGNGLEEFKRIASATFIVLAVVAMVFYLASYDASRGFVLTSLLVGLPLLLLGRFGVRQWLVRQRAQGRCMRRTLVVGQGPHSDMLVERLGADWFTGFTVVGRIAPPSSGTFVEEWLDDVDVALARDSVDAVAVAEGAGISPDMVRRLAWRLEGPRVELMVAPSLSDLAGPRLIFRPAAGLPLIHLDEPQLTGPKRALKRMVDIAAAAVALVLLSPFLLVVALLIKIGSRGPVFFTQERVGRHGETFRFLKFRTMVTGAHDMREHVIGEPDEDITERYKCDPRITAVGRFLRRWSIDELPQLVNVLVGQMSLVGPRPLLVDEIPLLADRDHRRHLTKPGLTGLWQVSGRKEVSWDERMRLDLWYVENWSPALDLVIVARTVRAVLSGEGAY